MKDDQLIIEGKVVKQGPQAHVTIPVSIRKRWSKAMKMDAAKLFNLPVIWYYKNGKITATIYLEKDV